MTAINPDTFVHIPEQDDDNCRKYGWKKGTVEVTLQGKTKTVSATHYGDQITAHGFVTKYRTGTKLWAASIMYRFARETFAAYESVCGGFDSRSGKHQRLNNVWFREPSHDLLISQR